MIQEKTSDKNVENLSWANIISTNKIYFLLQLIVILNLLIINDFYFKLLRNVVIDLYIKQKMGNLNAGYERHQNDLHLTAR